MSKEIFNFQNKNLFKDQNGNTYKFLKVVEGCCHYPYYLFLEIDTNNSYAYNKKGDRLDHNLNVIKDYSSRIIYEE